MKKGRSLKKIVQLWTFIGGGAAGSLFLTGRWLAAFVFVAIYVVLTLTPWRLLRYVNGVRYGGLQLTIPLEPLTGEVETVAKRRRHITAATSAISSAFKSSTTIDLMLCSGFQVVGTAAHHGWVHDELSRLPPSAAVRVLLLDPESDAAQQRGDQLMAAHGYVSYVEGVKAVTETFATLRSTRGLNVELRYYQEPPVWQMLIFPSEMFVMLASQRPTDRSPIWVFKRDGPYSMSRGLQEVFARRWDHPTSKHVDLSAAPVVDHAKVFNLLQ